MAKSDVQCNIVLQDRQQKNHIVLTDTNIVMKGDFFGDHQCEGQHEVEHVWLPMPPHKEPHHWNSNWQESRQLMNYALPERRQSEQQNLNRLILMLTQRPTVVPLMNPFGNLANIPHPTHQPYIQTRAGSDESTDDEERINQAFENQLNKLKNEIEKD